MQFKAVFITLASTALVGATASSKGNFPREKAFKVPLTGQAEIGVAAPGLAGDSDGAGMVELTVSSAENRICYDFKLSGVATPLMAHIHRARSKGIGPSVVTLFTGPGADLEGCLNWAHERLAENVSDPSEFYVNVYTTEFPEGAIRGQLAG